MAYFEVNLTSTNTGKASVEVTAENLARLLRWVCGPALLPEKSLEEMMWEDDGGALTVRCEGYEHTVNGT